MFVDCVDGYVARVEQLLPEGNSIKLITNAKLQRIAGDVVDGREPVHRSGDRYDQNTARHFG